MAFMYDYKWKIMHDFNNVVTFIRTESEIVNKHEMAAHQGSTYFVLSMTRTCESPKWSIA